LATIKIPNVALQLSELGDVLDHEDSAFLRFARNHRGLGAELNLPIPQVVFALDHRARWLMRELVE
jgi:hypothetical protein